MDALLLSCSGIFVILANPIMNTEVTNLQKKKKSCFNRDHYIVRKIIIFALIYIATKKIWISTLVTLLITFFNYKNDYQEQCVEYEKFK
jgi:hypothetical protein